MWKILRSDLRVLRDLAKRKAELADDPVNVGRRRLWHALDAGKGERPMLLTESWVAFEQLPDSRCRCREEWACGLERGLRFDIFQFEKVRDDHVIEPWMTCNWDVQVSDYGVASKQIYAERVSGNVSSRNWDPPLKNVDADLDKLRPRTYSVDREASLAWKAHLEEVFDGILPVRFRGGFWWTAGFTGTAIDLVGLEPFMTYMCTDPDGLHRLMAFLQREVIAYAEWLEREQLLSLNNENDYIGSGSMGYSRALPQTDWKQGDPVRLRDMWVLMESQETVLCGPDQCEEFVLSYYRRIAERFGRCYYGCCEPVHDRWHYVKKLARLKRLSISPWCDQAFMAEALGRDYVFSRKPNPTLVSTPDFDEDPIRKDLRSTLDVTRDCNVEIILKDVHTLCGEAHRIARWVEIAREMVEKHARKTKGGQHHAKKQQERRPVEKVLQLASGVQHGWLEDSEQPDFRLVHADGSVVGIEVITWYLPQEGAEVCPAAQDSLHKRVADRVSAILNSSGHRPIWATLHFRHQPAIVKKRVDDISTAVAAIILGSCGATTEWSSVPIEDGLPDELHAMLIHGSYYRGKKSLCCPTECGPIPSLTSSDVQRVIDGKAALMPGYQADLAEIWLVIEIHGFKVSSTAELDDSVISHAFQSPFTRMFILNEGSQLTELRRMLPT